MKRYLARFFSVAAAVLFLSVTILELTAEARIGGGRSMGSRGSRSYSRQAAPTQSMPRQATAPAPGGYQQGGGFMRSMAGGMAGGMLGSMLFGGTAGAGGMGPGTGGGGIGLFEIILLAGGGFFIYRLMQKGRR